MNTEVELSQSEVKDFYLASEGEMECFSFGPDSEPVYYQRVGDLMVSTVLH